MPLKTKDNAKLTPDNVSPELDAGRQPVIR
jgi:hypothetical protein